MTDLLSGKRVLIVEDNPAIAFDLDDLLKSQGATPVGPALDLPSAMELASKNPLDAAILDINLGDDWVWPLAHELKGHTVPFAFISAECSQEELPEDFQDNTCLDKPAREDEIIDTVRSLLAA